MGGSEEKRLYTKSEVDQLKKLQTERWRQIKYYGIKGDRCKYVNKILGSEALWIGNPFHSKYSDEREEPKSFLPYHVSFIIENGFLPSKGMSVSHRCDRWKKIRKGTKKSNKCVNPLHLVGESLSENNSRKVCHKIIRKKINPKRIKKGSIKCFYSISCGHIKAPCLINWGSSSSM